MIGVAEEMTNVAAIQRLESLNLHAPGENPHWLRIGTTVVSGRRIVAGQ